MNQSEPCLRNEPSEPCLRNEPSLHDNGKIQQAERLKYGSQAEIQPDQAQVRIDLNADMGESFGAWTMGQDEALMPLISSANIACGFHAGDPSTIRATVKLAAKHGVAIGAHPGLPDLQGFGRRTMSLSPDEAYELMLYQAGAVRAFAEAAGARLHHVKAHGALYNMAAKDVGLSRAMAQAVKDLGDQVQMYVLAGSVMEKEARDAGLDVRCEVFADRRYMPDGTLTPRSRSDALITDESESVAHVLRMVKEGHLIAVDGSRVDVVADSLCIHGDKATAVPFVKALRIALKQANVEVRAH
ncbi:MAG: LamB/YcsF family protein [Betaproteobacteria bacterium]|nr:LamB/YcsF family protein [Betaproteobacteria bacterium]